MTTAEPNKRVDTGMRILSMLLDHIIMTMVMMVFIVPFMMMDLFKNFNDPHQPPTFLFSGVGGYAMLFGFSLYFCKDIINGRSLAKRILKFQVLNHKTGLPASPLQCFVRNLFCVIWPVEFIVALFNSSRRIGDRVAGTRLVPYDATTEQPRVNVVYVILTILLSFTLTVMVSRLSDKIEWPDNGFVETSYNEKESKELEQVLTDSTGQYLQPSIRIYDQSKNNKLRYISAVLTLKENYLDDQQSYELLEKKVLDIIYTQHPRSSFKGTIKFMYKSPVRVMSRSTTMGAD